MSAQMKWNWNKTEQNSLKTVSKLFIVSAKSKRSGVMNLRVKLTKRYTYVSGDKKDSVYGWRSLVEPRQSQNCQRRNPHHCCHPVGNCSPEITTRTNSISGDNKPLSAEMGLSIFRGCNTRSSSVSLLCVPFWRTSFARRSFSTVAPLTLCLLLC